MGSSLQRMVLLSPRDRSADERKHTWNNMHKKNILFRLQHVGQAGGAGPHDAWQPGGGGDQEPRDQEQCD